MSFITSANTVQRSSLKTFISGPATCIIKNYTSKQLTALIHWDPGGWSISNLFPERTRTPQTILSNSHLQDNILLPLTLKPVIILMPYRVIYLVSASISLYRTATSPMERINLLL